MSCAHGAYLSFQVATLSSLRASAGAPPTAMIRSRDAGPKPVTRVIICAHVPRRPHERSFSAAALVAALASALIGACAKDPPHQSGTGGATLGGAGGGGGAAGSTVVSACSDPAALDRRPPRPAPARTRRPTAAGAATVTLAVDAGASVGAWNRFYERTVASDHANTLLCTAYGRNIQNALRKAHAQAGFQYVRFHGTLQRRRRRLFRRRVGRADLRLVAHRRDLRRHRGGGHAPAGRDQLHARRAGVRPERRCSTALVQQRVAQHQPADRRGRRLGQVDRADGAVRPPPGGPLHRRRGAQQLVLRGLERAVVDVFASATTATSSSTATPSPACWRAIRACAWAARPVRRANRRADRDADHADRSTPEQAGLPHVPPLRRRRRRGRSPT